MDIAIWVGNEAYPTAASFIDEARALGVSRKLSHLPKDLQKGNTRCFLMHKEGTQSSKLIGYFTIDALEVVIPGRKEELSETERALLLNEDVTSIAEAQIGMEPARGCGHRSRGGVYLVAKFKEDLIQIMESFKDVEKEYFMHGKFVVFPEPWPKAGIDFLRGMMFVEGDQILGDLMTGDYKESLNYYVPLKEYDEMKYGDFIAQLAKETGNTRAGTGRMINVAMRTIKDIVTSGDSLIIPNFGTFKIGTAAARTARNMHTGDLIDVPACQVPKFKAAMKFKREVKDARADESDLNESGGEAEDCVGDNERDSEDDHTTDLADSEGQAGSGGDTAEDCVGTGFDAAGTEPQAAGSAT